MGERGRGGRFGARPVAGDLTAGEVTAGQEAGRPVNRALCVWGWEGAEGEEREGEGVFCKTVKGFCYLILILGFSPFNS